MLPETTEAISLFGAVCTATAAATVALWRASRKVSADLPKFKEERAHSDFIERLHDEVSRLESIIEKMQTRIEELERKSLRAEGHVGVLRAEAIGVYTLLVGMHCTCHGEDQWALVHNGLKRIITTNDNS